MVDITLVRQLAEDFLVDSDSFLVDVEIRPGNAIVVEIDSERSITIEDCITLSRFIESKLDRESEDFELEVGSAGIGQPFKILRQYKKNIGNDVEVLIRTGRKFSGILKDATENNIVLTIEKQTKPEGSKRKIIVEEDLIFTYEEIKYTKYAIRFK